MRLTGKQPCPFLLLFSLQFFAVNTTVAGSGCGNSAVDPVLFQDGTRLRIDASQFCESSGVTVEENNEDGGGGMHVGSLDQYDWMAWDVDFIGGSGLYQVSYSVASLEGKGALQLETLGGDPVFGTVFDLPTTGNQNAFAVVDHTVNLPGGPRAIAIAILEGGFSIDWIEFVRVQEAPTASPTRYACATDEYRDIDRSLPNRIAAMDFCDSEGIQIEPSDEGGYNVGWIDAGDFMAYNVHIPATDTYELKYRVSSEQGIGAFVAEVYDETGFGTISHQVEVPSTGAWQAFTNVAQTIPMDEGETMIVIRATEHGWNLLWLEITALSQTSIPVNTPTVAPADAPTGGTPFGWIIPTPNFPRPINAPVMSPITAPVSPPVMSPVQPPVSPTPLSGFVRAEDKSIVDGDGKNLILRGQGFGGWMLQEPYQMLMVEAAPKGQWEMFERIVDTVGEEGLDAYHQAWLDNWCTHEDVKQLKADGFNSLRVALHYNLFTLPIEEEPVWGQDTWLQEGFDRLDLLLEWCRSEELYLILDLHAAPGGQGRNSAINDYDDRKPSLWEDDENVRKSVALWVKWAERYVDEKWIAGYDLLNEPNWNFEPGHPNGCTDVQNEPLKDFYDRAIEAIREVDKNHIIYINGNCWGNNHEGLWPFADNNVVLSFHRYWIPNTNSSIQGFLEMRDEYNVPLWMGESGENHDFWYQQAVQLLELHNIGWAWWTWKKLESSSGSFSIAPPDGYYNLVDHWAWGSPKPANAMNILLGLADNALLENCDRNDVAIQSLTGHVRTCQNSPSISIDHRLLGSTTRIQAEDYCSMHNVGIEVTADVGGGANLGWMGAGSTMSYHVTLRRKGRYAATFRYASLDGDGGFHISVNGEILGTIESLPATSDWQEWADISREIVLPRGDYTINITSLTAGWNINWFQLDRIRMSFEDMFPW